MDQLNYLLSPRHIAVIGASRSSHEIGHAILENIIRCGFKGEIYPVNPRENEISGLSCYPSIKQIGKPVEVAIIALPAARCQQAVQECGEVGVKGIIVVSAGFKETGAEGLKLEQKLAEICRHYGMRMVGPNCVGLMDTHIPLNASFVESFPEKGSISFISQSSAMLMAILDWSFTAGLGFSRFISYGNKADLGEVDFIKSCAADPNTRVILCYIEDIANGEEFIRVCSEVSKKKPLIVFKSGTSASGALAASSHTGALAGSNRSYETAFRQSGVIRAENINDLFDLARAFSTQPLPRSNRVAILTNSGGPAIVATDAIAGAGLEMAGLAQETVDLLRGNLPAEANIHNPVDLLGDAKAERFSFALEKLVNDQNVDGIIIIVGPSAVTEPEKVARAILDIKKRYPIKPLFAVYLGGKSLRRGREMLVHGEVPAFTFPESAVNAFEAMVKYARFKTKLPLPALRLREEQPVDKELVRVIFEHVLKDHRALLLGCEAAQVMEVYGIPVNRIKLASSAEEARDISRQIGYPVVLKISSPDIMHKTDVGGIEIGLYNKDEVGQAYRQIMKRVQKRCPGASIYGIEVQKMVKKGVEVIVGMSRDIQFGPLIAFGLGGTYVNLLQDVSFRLASALTSRQAIEEMIGETMAGTLLKGYRGQKPSDLDLLIETIYRFARLAEDFREIAVMEINPFCVYPQGAAALDIKILLRESKKRYTKQRSKIRSWV
jgi:acetyl coenzyme A synthetase (ADP forming)-like protein